MLGGDEVMKIDFLENHPDLVPELAKLHFDEWRHFSPDQTLEDRILKLQAMAQSGGVPFIAVAVDNNQLIGSSALVDEDMSTRKDLSPWLASVFVKPEFRKIGVGTSLVRFIEGEAQKRGIQELFLYTEHARNLYAALGWHDLEECEYQGVSVAIMYKQIAA